MRVPGRVVAAVLVVVLLGAMSVSPTFATGDIHHRVFATWAANNLAPTNQAGQLFPGTALDSQDVTAVAMSEKPTTNSSGNACVVASGTVYCWGNNVHGQIGDGTTTYRSTPVPVSSSSGLPQGSVTDVVTGDTFTCALAAGKVYCWGLGTGYQLATGSSSLLPIEIGGALTGVTVNEISGGTSWVGSGYMMARSGGAIYEWGSLYDHSCPNPGGGTTTCPTAITTPTLVGGPVGARAATRLYQDYGMPAVLADGNVWAWGMNRAGDLIGPSTVAVNITPDADGNTGQNLPNPLLGLDDVVIANGDVRGALKNGAVVLGGGGGIPPETTITRVFGGHFGSHYAKLFAVADDGSLWESSTNEPGTWMGFTKSDHYGDVQDIAMPGDYALNAVIAGLTKPGAPTGIVGSSTGSTNASVYWTAPTDSGGAPVTSYTIRRFLVGSETVDGTSSASGTSGVVVGLTKGQAYEFTVAANTAAGEGAPSPRSNAVFPGSVPPPGTNTGVTINRGANYTNTKNVSLNVVWPTNAVAMRVSNDGGFLPGLTQTVDPTGTTAWALDDSVAGLYTKIVYVRFDGYGIDSTRTYTDDIILDTNAPTVSAAAAKSTRSLPTSADRKVRTRKVTITSKVRDDKSGVSRVQVSNVKKAASGTVGNYKKSFTSKQPASAKSVFVRVCDRAGNWSAWKKVKVK